MTLQVDLDIVVFFYMVWGESISGFFEIMLIFIQFNGFKS